MWLRKDSIGWTYMLITLYTSTNKPLIRVLVLTSMLYRIPLASTDLTFPSSLVVARRKTRITSRTFSLSATRSWVQSSPREEPRMMRLRQIFHLSHR